ncbi:MAG: phenylalanine--tRNA ligase subunit beta [Defluviitaleaceae bacterium]|nr:phenylalanine--tRNA ligase subunit beta [Defluviitaleaceae bacterium]
MNVSLKWLEQLTNLKLDPKELENKLTMSGTKVEKIHYNGQNIKGILTGQITKIEKHPDADKLVICQVNMGTETLQIVTGATNVYENAIVPVATPNSVLSDGTKIKKGKLRGVESNGMLCSIEELGKTKDEFPEAPEDGIYIFKEETPLGIDAAEHLGLRETVLELELTSNRPDCYSMIGIAREASASYGKKFEEAELPKLNGTNPPTTMANIETPNCNRYMLLRVPNIKVCISSKEVQNKLRASGSRPINNIVDITNLVMLEYGQPLHAFDAEKVVGNITIRQAKNGETIKLLDSNEYTLTEEIMVIADEKAPIAIAGIMGGYDTRVTEETKTILLESANFDGPNIRNSSKILNIRTDASTHYEKGLDPNTSEKSLKRAVQLLNNYIENSGNINELFVDNYPNKIYTHEIPYSAENINSLLGINISNSEVENILNLLGIQTEAGVAKIPTFRKDMHGEADIAEEVIRIYGYDKLEPTMDKVVTLAKLTRSQKLEKFIKDFCISQGLYEIVTSSFETPELAKELGVNTEPITILNPLAGQSVMKVESATGMLSAMRLNYSRRNLNVNFFEFSKVYLKDTTGAEFKINETKVLTIGKYGGNSDFYSIKGIVEELLASLGISNFGRASIKFMPNSIPFLHNGRRASILIGEKELGYLGEVHPEILENYEINERAYLACLNFDELEKYADLERTYKPLPKFPSIKRDLTMIIKRYIYIDIVEKTLLKYGTSLLESVSFVSVYTGENVKETHKSVTYSLVFRSLEKTLEDSEVNEIMENIIKKCEEELIAIIKT